jgi:formylmethanofuran dehydrogenase subunit E
MENCLDNNFESLLEKSIKIHGHLCPGQVLGVRMAILGCRLVGINDPHSEKERKRLMVFVEMDRCATDAIQVVTGCTLGKRTMRFKDYGLMAATFWNTERDLAYRISAKEESKGKAIILFPEIKDPFHQQLKAYIQMTDDDLFSIMKVKVQIPPWELPGPPRFHAKCNLCGAVVRDGREVISRGLVLCRPCSGDSYFSQLTIEKIQDGLPKKEICL